MTPSPLPHPHNASEPAPAPARAALRDLLREAAATYWALVKVMVPVLVAVKLLQYAGVTARLGAALAPVMHLAGLPGSMGLVWATAMLVNLYTAIGVYVTLAGAEPLTVAQATVLAGMVLMAHGLPVELRIAQKAGARLRFMVVLRVAGALAFGCLLHLAYSRAGVLGAVSRPIFRPQPQVPWLLGLGEMLLKVFVIILGLLVLLKVLDRLGVTAVMTRLLQPVLRALGMSRRAAPVTIIGMTLGLTLGGGLIIREAQSGRLSRRDVFFSVALMGLCHSLIEDTLLMMSIGAHVTGVLVGRLVFSLAAVFLLVRLVALLPERAFERLLVRQRGP